MFRSFSLSQGFFVTLCSFTLAFSQYMTIFPSKYVFLFAIFVFELGSSSQYGDAFSLLSSSRFLTSFSLFSSFYQDLYSVE